MVTLCNIGAYAIAGALLVWFARECGTAYHAGRPVKEKETSMFALWVMFGAATIGAILADIWAARSNRAMGRRWLSEFEGRRYTGITKVQTGAPPPALTHYAPDGTGRPVTPLDQTEIYRRLVLDTHYHDRLASDRLRRAEGRRARRIQEGAAYAAKYGAAHWPPS
jgi:hypothetical protein